MASQVEGRKLESRCPLQIFQGDKSWAYNPFSFSAYFQFSDGTFIPGKIPSGQTPRQYGEASFLYEHACVSTPACQHLRKRPPENITSRPVPSDAPSLPLHSRGNDPGSAHPRKNMPKRKQTSSLPLGPRYEPSRLRQSSRASPAKASISSGRRPSNGLFSAALSHSGFGGTWRKSAGRMPYRFSR